MRCFALLAFVPALAFAGDWNTAAPVAKPGSFQAWATAVVESLPDHQGEPVVVEEPSCGCGDACKCAPCVRADGCKCDPCGCSDCPHHSVDANKMVPPLVITVADRGCPPCERFKQDALPRLVRAGWVETQHYTLRVVPLGSETVPSFTWHGVRFSPEGYRGWGDWRQDLRVAMGDAYRGEANRRPSESRGAQAATGEAAPPKTQPLTSQGATGYRVENPVSGDSEQGTDREGAIVDRPVSGRQDAAAPGWHSHQCPCGHRWSHDVNNLGDWWAAHTCDRCGRLVTVHAE